MTNTIESPRVHRVRSRPDIRIVHLGLGAFHRAHQAWYTDAVDHGREWGIAAFSGRRPDAAESLARQDGVFTLIERGPDRDQCSTVESIVEARDGADLARLRALVSSSRVALITITVTEAAYHLGADGALDLGADAIVADIERLRTGVDPVTMPGRLFDALRARLDAAGGPIAVVSCDNLAQNAAATRSGVLSLARAVAPTLEQRLDEMVSFVSTSVDRITPRATERDLDEVVRHTGFLDRDPVVTEPFTSWVLAGEFPAGRPPWERAGALFVTDIEPFERRKLWLLNAAHSLLAYEGSARGYTTVAEALADETCAEWVDRLWDEAAPHLVGVGLDIPQYRAALLARFRNARIAHHLRQIATDGVVKLRTRAVPILRAERDAGRDGAAAARLIAAWIAYVQAAEADDRLADAQAAAVRSGLAEPDPVAALLDLLDPELGRRAGVLDLVRGHHAALVALAPTV